MTVDFLLTKSNSQVMRYNPRIRHIYEAENGSDGWWLPHDEERGWLWSNSSPPRVRPDWCARTGPATTPSHGRGPGSAARGGRPPLDGALNPTGLPEPHRTPRWRGFGSSAANEQRRG